MTTIAYRNGIMASDSQATGGEIVRGETTKLHRTIHGTLIGISGHSGLTPLLIAWVEGGRKWEDRPTLPQHVELHAIIVRPRGTITVLSQDFIEQPVETPFIAVGSGNELATGAMAMGATAAEAVEVAARFDVYTGGRIVTLPLVPSASPLSRSS